MGAPPLRGAI